MALDQALLESVATGESLPLLRLYRWHPATVSLGYGQALKRAVNQEACQSAGVSLVRRCTGGRAVLHASEVTYAVIAAEGRDGFAADILSSYRQIALALQDALTCLGLPVKLQTGHERGRTVRNEQSICFAVPAQYELLLDGCKLAGSAQRRWKGAFLQHGSLPLDLDPDLLYCLLTPQPAKDRDTAVKRLTRRVGWINRWAAHPFSTSEVESALVAAFARQFGIGWQADVPTSAEFRRADQLVDSRYRQLDWTAAERSDGPV